MKTYFVDSFTTEPFKGNPAGVCLCAKDLSSDLMQNIAKEIGFSETAFIRRLETDNSYRIRFFSPKQEIPLCGHATLAASKIIFHATALMNINFITRHNVELKIAKESNKIVMEFPVYDTSDIDVPPIMLQALGIESIVKSSFSVANEIILLEIEDAKTLSSLKPDFSALVRSYDGINGVLVTAPSDSPQFDFHYRYFWPWSGTNEDPVTGGVQTFLTKYWVQKLKKTRLNAFQASERTGFMTTELRGDKVLIYGEAVIVFEGDIKIESKC
jgi:PhzF family phenazine biosynthesis protein